MENDLIIKKPILAISKFWVPMIIGNLFNQLYNIVDTIVVGNYINSDALAAVGTSGIIMSVISMSALGLAVGSSVVVAQSYGAKRFSETKSAVSTSIILFLICGVVGSIVGEAIKIPMLNLLGTPSDYYAYANEYLTVIFFGIVFTMLYNVLNQISIALGDSKTPMFMLLIASVINIILDLYFTLNLKMGVTGVAVATLIGQAFAAGMCLLIIKKKLDAMPSEQETNGKAFDKNLLKPILSIGLPALFQNIISSSGSLAMQRLYNSFGTVTVAAFTAANKIDGFGMSPMVSLGSAISTYTAQNIGAKKYDRVNEGLNSSFLLTAVSCAITGVIIYFNASSLMKIFVSSLDANSADIVNIGREYLHVAVFSYAVMAFMFIYTGLLKGAGDAKTVFWCSIADLLGRAVFAYVFAGLLGRYALWLSYPFGWACSLAISAPVYYRGKWKEIRVLRSSLTQQENV